MVKLRHYLVISASELTGTFACGHCEYIGIFNFVDGALECPRCKESWNTAPVAYQLSIKKGGDRRNYDSSYVMCEDCEGFHEDRYEGEHWCEIQNDWLSDLKVSCYEEHKCDKFKLKSKEEA
jgi:hypothetical protein